MTSMPDDSRSPPSDWTERLRSLVDQTVERSSASTANLERLLVAAVAPGVNPEEWTSELTRQSGEHGTEAYRELSEVTTRFGSESLRVVARYLDAYLRELVPPGQAGRVGKPPAMPLPPASTDALAWTAWYQRYATWVSDQQAWSSRLLTVIREEVAAGRLRSDAMQTSARRFVEQHLPDYLVAMAELNTDLVSDVLGVADETLERLADALVKDTSDQLAVDVRGEAGSAVVVSLVVENSRPEAAVIRCEGAPKEGFGLASDPAIFSLDPAESRPVSIRVTLPSTPTSGAVDAGTVSVRGQDERDLVVWIRATIDARAATMTRGPSVRFPDEPRAEPPNDEPESSS
jgi:hypothetical protein